MNKRQSGPGSVPFPIPSILDEPDNRDLLPGILHINHALDLNKGHEGISEKLGYVEGQLHDLCQKFTTSKSSWDEMTCLTSLPWDVVSCVADAL